MNNIFADRISDVPRSFIREILKVAIDPSVTSFAGGLPNRDLFPVAELQAATEKVFRTAARESLQYSNSEGYLQLRQYIADRYRQRQNLSVSTDNILITNGSQQGLDLLAKTLLNEGDDVIIEEPGYLGAIQAFAVYRAVFNPVPVDEEGLDVDALKRVLRAKSPKLLYGVPNYQNPSGISYSTDNRQKVAEVLSGSTTLLIEDDPYGDLRFSGTGRPSFKSLIPNQTVLLGSFSKTIAPAFRIGWILAPDSIVDKLLVAKQTSDLHTGYFVQRVIHQYLTDNDLDEHIKKITRAYGNQCVAMIRSIKKHFPPGVSYTKPEGGMFLWATLPENISSMDLFDLAINDKVAFVPGDPFYINRQQTNTLRLNFSCVDEDTIEIGIERLGRAMKQLLEL